MSSSPEPGDTRAPVGPTDAAWALVLALGLGVAADRLLWDGPFGPGMVVWLALLGAAAVFLARRTGGLPAWRATLGWAVVAVTAATFTAWRASEAIAPLLWVVIIASASMVVLRARGVRLGHSLVSDHIVGLTEVPLTAALGALPLLGRVELPERPARRRVVALGRGLALSLPLLALFGGLFASADATFSRYATQLASLVSDQLPLHVGLTLGFAWIGAGLLRGVLPKPAFNPLRELRVPRLGIEEISVALGLLCVLFLMFVALQLGYLFGGRAVIERTTDLTVAEYARRGFFELVAVGALVLGVLMVAAAVAPRDAGRWVFRALAGLLIVLVLVILASAAQRLLLYQAEFGLTLDRVLAATVMVWVAFVLGFFAVTVIRDRSRPFASGALVAGVVVVLTLALINPDALVARTNFDRASPRDVDTAYLNRLSADAAPVLLARLDELGAEGRCAVANALLERYGTPRDGDWRTWNRAVAVAEKQVREARPALEHACGERP